MLLHLRSQVSSLGLPSRQHRKKSPGILDSRLRSLPRARINPQNRLRPPSRRGSQNDQNYGSNRNTKLPQPSPLSCLCAFSISTRELALLPRTPLGSQRASRRKPTEYGKTHCAHRNPPLARLAPYPLRATLAAPSATGAGTNRFPTATVTVGRA